MLNHAQQQIADELSRMFGISQSGTMQQANVTATQAQARLAAQTQSQQQWMAQMQQAVSRAMPKQWDADWYARARRGLYKLMDHEMPTSEEARTILELGVSIELVCRDADADDVARMHIALQRATRGEELTFYDQELLEELHEHLNRYEGDNCAYSIEAVSMENGRLTLDIKIKPTRPISHVELDLTITPEKVDIVDGEGDIMPASVARRIGERATQDLLRRGQVEVSEKEMRGTYRTVTPDDYRNQYMNAPAPQEPIDWREEVQRMAREEMMALKAK
jgi:hypothetical protein